MAGGQACAQDQYLSFGTGGTPMALGGDYRALGWNPAQITFSPLNQDDWKSAAGGVEFGARVSSSALSRADIWNSILNRGNASIDQWTGQDWTQYVDLLTNKSIGPRHQNSTLYQIHLTILQRQSAHRAQ